MLQEEQAFEDNVRQTIRLDDKRPQANAKLQRQRGFQDNAELQRQHGLQDNAHNARMLAIEKELQQASRNHRQESALQPPPQRGGGFNTKYIKRKSKKTTKRKNKCNRPTKSKQ